jgi:hypothetical protein
MPNERIITVSDELERIRKEAVTVYFQVPYQRFLGDIGEQRKPSVSPDQDQNPRQPGQVSKGPTSHPFMALWLHTHTRLNPIWAVGTSLGTHSSVWLAKRYDYSTQLCWHTDIPMTSYRRHQRPSLLSLSCVRVSYGIRFLSNCESSLHPPPRICVGQVYCVLHAVYERYKPSSLNFPVNGEWRVLLHDGKLENLNFLTLEGVSHLQAEALVSDRWTTWTCFPHAL